MDAVHLGNEDGSDSLIQSSTIHVDGCPHREHKTGDPLVNTEVFLQAAEGDRQCTSTRRRNKGNYVIVCMICLKIKNSLSLCLNSDLEAVPRAVIQAWKMPRKKVKGFFLTITK